MSYKFTGSKTEKKIGTIIVQKKRKNKDKQIRSTSYWRGNNYIGSNREMSSLASTGHLYHPERERERELT